VSTTTIQTLGDRLGNPGSAEPQPGWSMVRSGTAAVMPAGGQFGDCRSVFRPDPPTRARPGEAKRTPSPPTTPKSTTSTRTWPVPTPQNSPA